AIMSSACDPVMRAFAEHRFFLLKARVLLLTLLVVALWFVTRHYGMVGTIATATLVNVVERSVTLWKVGRVLGVGRGDFVLLKDIGKIALGAAGAGLVLLLLQSYLPSGSALLRLALCGITLVIVYPANLLLLGVPAGDERRAAARRLGSLVRRF